MCFRIVRIQGDGSIKITLAKEDRCEIIKDEDKSTAFINSGAQAVYGYSTNSDGYKKFNYEEYSGGLYTKLNSWYNSKLAIITDKLKNETWCLGDSSLSDEDAKKLMEAEQYPTFAYDAYVRLEGRQASYKCSSESETTTKYIGALLSDEIAYAGDIISYLSSNQTHYLRDNALNKWYWLLSHAIYDTNVDYAGAIIIDDLHDSSFNHYSVVGLLSVRPAITLKSGVELLSGVGTQTIPYKIK